MSVCLSLCLLTTSIKKFWEEFYKILKCCYLQQEEIIKLWLTLLQICCHGNHFQCMSCKFKISNRTISTSTKRVGSGTIRKLSGSSVEMSHRDWDGNIFCVKSSTQQGSTFQVTFSPLLLESSVQESSPWKNFWHMLSKLAVVSAEGCTVWVLFYSI